MAGADDTSRRASQVPTIARWLAMPPDKLREMVSPRRLALFMSIDGTQRHYLLNKSPRSERITDFEDYCRHASAAYVRVFELFYNLGINTIMAPILIENNFWRGEAYQRQALAMSERFLLQAPFTALYERMQIQARLYGDYAFAPGAGHIRAGLLKMEAELAQLAPQGERKLLMGFSAGSLADEMIHRTIEYYRETGRVPTEDELRARWFPAGPQRLHLFVSSGWLLHGGLVPPVYANQALDIYNLSRLILDLSEEQARRMIYDHLFLRHRAAYDDTRYSLAHLDEMDQFYSAHDDCLLGLGQLVGPDLWYADHQHPVRP